MDVKPKVRQEVQRQRTQKIRDEDRIVARDTQVTYESKIESETYTNLFALSLLSRTPSLSTTWFFSLSLPLVLSFSLFSHSENRTNQTSTIVHDRSSKCTRFFSRLLLPARGGAYLSSRRWSTPTRLLRQSRIIFTWRSLSKTDTSK